MRAAGEGDGEALDIAHDEALRPVAQRDVDERGVFALHRQEVGDDAEDRVPRARRGLLDQRDHLAHAGAEALAAADQPVEHAGAACEPAAFLPQLRDALAGAVTELTEALVFAARVLEAATRVGEAIVDLRVGRHQLLQLDVDRCQVLGGLLGAVVQTVPLAAEVIEPGVGADGLVLAMGFAAHLIEVLGLVLGELRVQRVEPGQRRGQGGGAGCDLFTLRCWSGMRRRPRRVRGRPAPRLPPAP